jgi:hypothetical protein
MLASPHPLAATNNWDGAWYESIALHGYGYAQNGAQTDRAFFPLFPLLAHILMFARVPWTIAALTIDNGCFLVALLFIYRIAERMWNARQARWCVAFACACPMSLFASAAYPEALYLALTAAALWTHATGSRARAVILTAAATAASAVGVALGAALVVTALAQRQWRYAVVALASFAGIAAFAIFCAMRFGDPLAFVHAQHAWRSSLGFNAAAWWNLLRSLASIDGFRLNVMTVVLVPLAAIATIVQRRALGPVMCTYALFAIALLAFSGEPISADRKAFTVVPILLSLGRPLARSRPFGIAVILILAALLAADSWSFARFLWVG